MGDPNFGYIDTGRQASESDQFHVICCVPFAFAIHICCHANMPTAGVWIFYLFPIYKRVTVSVMSYGQENLMGCDTTSNFWVSISKLPCLEP